MGSRTNKVFDKRWGWLIPILLLPLAALMGCRQLAYTKLNLAPVALVRGPYLQSVTHDGVLIVWETDQPGDSRVDYGYTPRHGFSVSDSTPTTRHVVQLSGLKPYTTVYYRASSNKQPMSEEGSFRTAPAVTQTTFSFAVLGDSRGYGSTLDHQSVISSIVPLKPDIVLHMGDLTEDGLVFEQWDREVFKVEQPLLRQAPLYTTLGNHDRESPYYFDLFYLPGNERWYSFDYGNIHFACLEVDRDGGFVLGSGQAAWFENDLALTRQPWKIVFLHYPLYSSGNNGVDDRTRNRIEPLFIRYGVDVVFSGHDHDYERLMANNIVYIVTGGGGSGLGSKPKTDPASVFFMLAHHFVSVTVNGMQLNFAGVLPDGARFDQFTLYKTTPWQRPIVK